MIGGTGDLLHGITMLGETSRGHGGPRITKFRAMSQVKNSSITPKSPPGWVKTFKLKTYMYIYIYIMHAWGMNISLPLFLNYFDVKARPPWFIWPVKSW